MTIIFEMGFENYFQTCRKDPIIYECILVSVKHLRHDLALPGLAEEFQKGKKVKSEENSCEGSLTEYVCGRALKEMKNETRNCVAGVTRTFKPHCDSPVIF